MVSPHECSSSRLPPCSTPSFWSPARSEFSREEIITDDGNNFTDRPFLSLHQHGDTSGTPLRRQHEGDIIARKELSPLKMAASLIQSLDIAHTEMTSFAADAAANAERARRNARTAQEIVRRYQNRSNTMLKIDKLEAPNFAVENFASVTEASSSSTLTASHPQRPEIVRFHDFRPSCTSNLKNFESQSGEEKCDENKGNKEHKNGDNHNAMVRVTTPVGVKHSGIKDKTLYDAKNRGGVHLPTSFERIAQHHADDVLQLTLELERTKQVLKSEQRLRKDCQSSLSLLQSKNIKLENGYQKLVDNYDMERKQSATQISLLEQELEQSRSRVQAAEEDAQLALDLAKSSSEDREKIEESLLEAEKEIKNLKEQQDDKLQLVTLGSLKRNVHFADNVIDSSTGHVSVKKNDEKASAEFFNITRENGPPRSMIAAGRQLLLRRSMSPQDAVIRLELTPTKSAERRQQLCQRLNAHLSESSNEDTNIKLLSFLPCRTLTSPNPGTKTESSEDISTCSSIHGTISKKKIEEYHTAIKILQISGKRLGLDGYWWNGYGNTMPSPNSIQIDVMTRQYCKNMEFKIDRQQTDINQLQSFCGYLEKKLFSDEIANDC